jgi:YebC/PmpR family DNA-binding regulatory protein
MAGHNKWSKIARKKGVSDQKRGKIFSKIIREITVAVKAGGPDPDANARLKTALLTGKANNLPKDVAERAITKASGGPDGANFDEITYEGYGPGGTALMVACLTDNKTRTVAEVRHIITKYGGNLGSTGSVNFMFDKKGIIEVKKESVTEDELMEITLDAGAEDVTDEGDTFYVVTSPQDFEPVRTAIEQAGKEIVSAEVTFIPQNTVKIGGSKAESLLKLIDLLEDNDDVQNVYSNFDIEE